MGPEPADFLYPFLDEAPTDRRALLEEMSDAARSKAVDSERVATAALDENADRLAEAAQAMAQRFRAGGRLYAFGNGGSATDAASVAARFVRPPSGMPLAARNLAADPAILTALGNDIGFDLVFSRQLIAHARPHDIALGLSTSGSSRNLLIAFEEARRRSVLTVGVAGYGGGAMATLALDHCLVVRSDSVHRVQEAHAALTGRLWELVQEALTAVSTDV